MTITCERDYLSATDPAALLTWATDETLAHPPGWLSMSEGQMRLWCVACLGHCDQEMLKEFSRRGYDDYSGYGSEGENIGSEDLPMVTRDWAASQRGYDPTAAAKADLLRDIYGNPWRRLTLACCPKCQRMKRTATLQEFGPCQDCHGVGGVAPWLTPTVCHLAASIHTGNQHGDPVALLALRDELLEAGLAEERRCEECRGIGVRRGSPPPGGQWPDGGRCPTCRGTGTVRDEAAAELLRHLSQEERCPECLGTGVEWTDDDAVASQRVGCHVCDGTGWRKRETPCVRGCWAISLLKGE